MTRDQEVAEYNFIRNEVLISGDVDAVMRFYAKYHPDQPFRNRLTAEAAMHKARTAIVDLPVKERVASFVWLTKHGLASWDDGELAKLAKEHA